MKKNNASPKDAKSRHWAFVVYPGKQIDWREVLRQNAVPCAISPLHDRDVWEEDTEDHKAGDLKKPHFHILLSYDGPTTYQNIKKLSESCGGTKKVEKVSSARGYYRYLTHKDDHDKYQYDEEDIKLLNGFNPADNGLTDSEVDRIIAELTKLATSQGWIEYRSMMLYLIHNEMWPEFRVARRHTVFFGEFFRGCYREKMRAAQAQADHSTGEALSKSDLAERNAQWVREGCPESYTRDLFGNIITHEGVNADE